MINNSKEVDSPTKQEGNTNDSKVSKPASSSSSSWLRLKDPRIVRVSRAFGGKDRHSKVCTVRGLRDRRVRLSVPTAIQLYDLQDRLGLNQPSKVVDWLLNAAKDEIDELPPLPIQPGSFAFNHQMVLTSSQEAAAADVASAAGSDAFWKAKSKEVARGTTDEKDEEERANHSSFPAMLNNGLPYGSYYPLEPSNFPLPHLGSHGFAPNTDDAAHNYNVAAPLPPSTLSLSSGSQIFVCPPGATQPLFPPHATTSADIDPRQQFNHFQMLSSSVQHLLPIPLNPPPAAYSINQSIRPFHFSMSSRLPHSHNGGGSQAEKQQQFSSK